LLSPFIKKVMAWAKMGKITKNTKIILILILGLACLIRFWALDKVPVSLYSDEVEVGYQAYSILKTGRDYYGNFMPIEFHSFAEWSTPLYIYSSIPTVALFGISSLGVRFPAAIFGALSILAFYFLVGQITKNDKIALLSSFVLTISPWHIQYSRVGFPATELLFFLVSGLYFFFRSLADKGKWLWISAVFLTLTPWVYSTAKLFTPILMLFLAIVWRKELISFSKKYLARAVLAILIIGAPIVYGTLFGGGLQRFDYISVFTDPTVSGEVSYARLTDAQIEGSARSLLLKIDSRFIHNKYTFWASKIVENFYKSFSTEFLFIKGDVNLRHSIEGVGQLYRIEALALLLGVVSFFLIYKDRQVKALVAFWILAGTVPAAITRDGAGHATRLILILPPLVLLISYGLTHGFDLFGKNIKKGLLAGYLILLAINFWSYQHNYWVHNPWYSERSWAAGYKEMIEMAKKYEKDYQKVVITDADEPPYMFFASYYPVPPQRWQAGLEEEYIQGFGNIKHLGKYYFGQVGKVGLKGLGEVMDENTLYIAAQREWASNLIMEPKKLPAGLELLGAVAYPSGEPAFYAFAKEEN